MIATRPTIPRAELAAVPGSTCKSHRRTPSWGGDFTREEGMAATTVGLGGGGAMYCPRISPHRLPNGNRVMFVACDMRGLYRSLDNGQRWTMLDTRLVYGSSRFSVAFHPAIAGHVLAFRPHQGLKVSSNNGDSWSDLSPALPLAPGESVTAAGYSPEPVPQLLVGTTRGVYRLDPTAAAWTQALAGTDQPVPRAPNATVSVPDVNSADVLGFVFLTDPATGQVAYFVATVTDVLESTDRGQSWQSIGGGLPGRPPGPFVAATDGAFPPLEYYASRVRGLAGANDAGAARLVLYATVRTEVADIATAGGVYRYERTAGGPGTWQRAMGAGSGINLSVGNQGGGTDVPRYEHLAVGAGVPDTVYVTAVNTTYVPNVYKGTYAGGQMSWAAAYDGFQHNQSRNVQGGWLDYRPRPAPGAATPADEVGLDWGFGGAARGFTIDPLDANALLFTNNGAVHATWNGAVTWEQVYTRHVVTAARRGWSSVGLEVTTTWQYFVHPAKPHLHFIACTDIGLARSDDGGDTWTSISQATALNNPGTLKDWRNFYELTWTTDVSGAIRLWAAVSDHHDIPHATEFGKALKSGAVLTSDDDGQTWREFDIPPGPVVSITVGPLIGSERMLYASVWGKGVYAWQWDRSSMQGSGVLLPTAGLPTSLYVYRVDYRLLYRTATAWFGAIFCVVSGHSTGGPNGTFLPGGLYWLPAGLPNQTAVWGDLTANLPQKPQLCPTDFAFSGGAVGAIALCARAVPGNNGGGGHYLFETQVGLFPSATPAWSAIGIPFPSPPAPAPYHDTVQGFAPFYDEQGALYITSTSHGIWRRPSAGALWEEVKEIPFLGAQRLRFGAWGWPVGPPWMYFLFQERTLHIMTFGGGVWKVTQRRGRSPMRIFLDRVKLLLSRFGG
jgi:hypothetical protein